MNYFDPTKEKLNEIIFILRYSGLLHMIDFLPTFLYLSGENDVPGLDGINQWEAISKDLPSPRKMMIYNMDDVFVPSVLASELVYQKFQVREVNI